MGPEVCLESLGLRVTVASMAFLAYLETRDTGETLEE